MTRFGDVVDVGATTTGAVGAGVTALAAGDGAAGADAAIPVTSVVGITLSGFDIAVGSFNVTAGRAVRLTVTVSVGAAAACTAAPQVGAVNADVVATDSVTVPVAVAATTVDPAGATLGAGAVGATLAAGAVGATPSTDAVGVTRRTVGVGVFVLVGETTLTTRGLTATGAGDTAPELERWRSAAPGAAPATAVADGWGVVNNAGTVVVPTGSVVFGAGDFAVLAAAGVVGPTALVVVVIFAPGVAGDGVFTVILPAGVLGASVFVATFPP